MLLKRKRKIMESDGKVEISPNKKEIKGSGVSGNNEDTGVSEEGPKDRENSSIQEDKESKSIPKDGENVSTPKNKGRSSIQEDNGNSLISEGSGNDEVEISDEIETLCEDSIDDSLNMVDDPAGNSVDNSEDGAGDPEGDSSDETGSFKEDSADETGNGEVESEDDEESKGEGSEPLGNFRKVAEAFAKGRGLTGEELEDGLMQIQVIGEGWRSGELTTDMLDLLLKGLSYDKDMERAVSEAELRGRNAAIDEGFMQEPISDGLPHLGSGGSVGNGGKMNSIFDLAREAGY